MDIGIVLAELRQERDRIAEAIVALERMAIGHQQKRRGRPPAWMVAAREVTMTKKTRLSRKQQEHG